MFSEYDDAEKMCREWRRREEVGWRESGERREAEDVDRGWEECCVAGAAEE